MDLATLKSTAAFVVACFSLAVGVSGYAKTYEFVPVISDPKIQQLVYSQGKPVGLSVLPTSAVAISCDLQSGDLWVNVSAENMSSAALDINPLKTQVVVYPEKKPEKVLEVYDPVKYVARLRRNQAWAVALGGLSNALNSRNAGNSYSTTNFSGVGGGTSFSGVATTETYDYSKEMAVRQAQQYQLMQQASAYRASSDSVDAALLKQNTLPPRWMINGAVLCRFVKAPRIRITLPLGTDVHQLEFKVEAR